LIQKSIIWWPDHCQQQLSLSMLESQEFLSPPIKKIEKKIKFDIKIDFLKIKGIGYVRIKKDGKLK